MTKENRIIIIAYNRHTHTHTHTDTHTVTNIHIHQNSSHRVQTQSQFIAELWSLLQVRQLSSAPCKTPFIFHCDCHCTRNHYDQVRFDELHGYMDVYIFFFFLWANSSFNTHVLFPTLKVFCCSLSISAAVQHFSQAIRAQGKFYF